MTPEFAEAFVAMQAELPAVPKSRKGQEGKQHYKYADLASIMEAAVPVMHKHGFAIIQKPIVFDKDGITMAGVRADLVHKTGHVESCEFSMPVVKDYGTLAKAVGGVITYARRYSLAILGICTEDDSESAPGVGSRPNLTPPKSPSPVKSKPSGTASPMSNVNKTKLSYAAKERVKELEDESIGHLEIINDTAKRLGKGDAKGLTDDDFEAALTIVQDWEPGGVKA